MTMLNSTPQTHRTKVLRAIAEKAHDATARIQYLNVLARNAQEALDEMPDDVTDRLSWLNQRLHNSN